MNKKLLTALGCSSSVAFSLVGVNSVQAKEYVFTAPEIADRAEIPASATDYPFADCSCDSYDAETIKKLDKEGDKAIQLYGCDCAGCRNLVRNVDADQPLS
ncbi:MAG: hypothetical protein AAFQ14_04810 [Cyanobacteria bacterium J06621_12]